MLFSSPERAKPFLQDSPGYTGGILESFKWGLERMGTGYGIALNPGSEIGFDMEPETVDELVRRVAQEGAPGLSSERLQ